MLSISVVLATYNEEETLGDCLKSVVDWADEIVVVDGFSTDKTVAIAKQFKAKVIQSKNVPIFHVNKQRAIDLAKTDWILQLDADERVTPELREEILKKIHSNPVENGFWIPRKNYFLGRYLTKGGQYPDFTMRLYRKEKGHLPCKSVHEQAVIEGEAGYLENPLIHIADPSFERYLTRFNRYTSLLALELQQDSVSLTISNFLNYFLVKPIRWFLLTFVRHRGFADGFPGFVFSLFSALRFPVAFIKYREKSHAR